MIDMRHSSKAPAIGYATAGSRRLHLAATSRARAADWAIRAIRLSVLLIAVLLNGDFHPALLPGGEGSTAQQYVGLLCWLVVIGGSFIASPRFEVAWSAGLYINLAFYALAILSFLWSQNPGASLPKCTTLAIVLFGAWRLTLILDWEEIVRVTHDGLFWVGVASIVIALAAPSIGVQATWQHSGQWNGVFYSKQTLGVCSAVQLFQASYRLMNGARGVYYWLSSVVAIVCVLASGSRGGGALAVIALMALYAMRLSPAFARAMAFVPVVMGLFAALLIADLLVTENRYLHIFGINLDFTERTFIWQHALRFFWQAPWLGYGLNGFWTLDWVKDAYLARYSWYLDNYHNGYINVLVETGFIGFSLFLLGYLLFGFRMNEIVARGYFPEKQTSFGLGFTFLLFVIDFTEAFFLRSTNFRSTMLVMIVAFAFARPIPRPENAFGSETHRDPGRRRARAAGGVIMRILTAALLSIAFAARAATGVPTAAEASLRRGINILGYDGLWKGEVDNPFRMQDFARIRDAGFDHVRVNFFGLRYRNDKGLLDETVLRRLDHVLDEAARNDLRVVLDQHDNDACNSAPEKCRELIAGFWRQIARRYAGTRPGLIYEILNEPGWKMDAVTWNGVVAAAIREIRARDRTRAIIVAALNNGDPRAVEKLDLPAEDQHLIVTIHYYAPMSFTHQGAPWSPDYRELENVSWGAPASRAAVDADFAPTAQWARAQGRPIYLGEFGALETAPPKSRMAWTRHVARTAEALGWSWAYWQFDHDFALTDPATRAWNGPLLDALMK